MFVLLFKDFLVSHEIRGREAETVMDAFDCGCGVHDDFVKALPFFIAFACLEIHGTRIASKFQMVFNFILVQL